jgi:AcrR family transcriptional regulator
MGRPPKNAFGEETTTRLLRAAEEAFGAAGYRQARLADIAASAGIRRSSLLYHFGSKERLYAEVVERAFDELRTTIGEAIIAGPGEPFDAVDRLVEAMVTFGEARPAVVGVLVREMVDPSGAGQVLQAFGRLLDGLEQAFRAVAATLVPADFPVRAAIMQLISSYLLRYAAGDAAPTLWGDGRHTQRLARALMLGERSRSPSGEAGAAD